MAARNYSPPWRRTLGYVALIVFGLIFIGPFLIQLATSFKTDADAANNSLSLIPHPVTLTAWERTFGFTENSGVPFGRWLTNSIVVATFITLGRVFLDSRLGVAGIGEPQEAPVDRRGARRQVDWLAHVGPPSVRS